MTIGAQMTRALIVDPDEVSRERIENVLDDIGVEHDFANTAEEALRSTLQYGLYVVESLLQGIDGVQLSERLRAATNAPIVILSGCCELPWKVAGYYAGADIYLCKPIEPAELKITLLSVLRRAGI